MDEGKINYYHVLKTLTIEALQHQFPDATITIENGNFAVRGCAKDVKAIQDIIETFYEPDNTEYQK